MNSSNIWQNYNKYQIGSKIKWQHIYLYKIVQFRQDMQTFMQMEIWADLCIFPNG